MPVGTSVKAAAGGVVLYSKVDSSESGGYGQYVAIKHDDGTVTLYGHLSARDVVAKQRVEAGEQIGLSGNTGKSTGPHLHFQITEGDPFTGKVINPTKVTSGIGSENISTNGNIYVEQQNISNFSANEISGLKGFFKSFYEEASSLVQNLKTSFLDIFNNAFSDNTDNAPKNSDGTVNFNLIDNTNLDLSIRTDRTQGFLSNQNTTQTGNALGDGDWEVKMPLSIINGDNYKNVAPSGIVTDFFNPGRQEQSEYQSFVRDYTKDLGGLSKSIWNTSAAESIWNSTKLNVNLSNLTNNAIGARTFVNIDPVVLDLNDDGVKLTSYNNSEVTFDVDNYGKQERIGWVSKEIFRVISIAIIILTILITPLESYAITPEEAENNALEYALKLQNINTPDHKRLWVEMKRLREERDNPSFKGEKNLIKFLIQKYDLDPINNANDQCKLMEMMVGYMIGGQHFSGLKTYCADGAGCAKYYSIISEEQFNSMLKYGEGDGEGGDQSSYLITDSYSRPIGIWSSFNKQFSVKKGFYKISQSHKMPENYNELYLLLPVKKINTTDSYMKINNCYIKEIRLRLDTTYIHPDYSKNYKSENFNN